MAAGVSIFPNYLLKGLIITSVFALTSSFVGVPYSVQNVDSGILPDIEVSRLYSIHRVRRQAAGTSSLNDTTTAVPVTMETTTTPASTSAVTTDAVTTSAPSTTQQPTTTSTAKPMSTTTNPLTNANIIEDSHRYYSSSTVIDKKTARNYWVDLDDPSINAKVITHSTLSSSHRTAASISLKFDFPFYGHLLRKITIATGGFLYVSDFLHRWLTATQYIAPLMANFDTRIGQTSNIKYLSHDSMLVAQWEDVYLQDEESAGSFTFQVTLHKSGKIVFAYRRVPKAIQTLSTLNHPVKVGVSDAYYSDRIDGNLRRRTIVEYHKVSISNEWIDSDTAVVLLPVTTCISITDCDTCVTAKIGFKCAWCGKLKKCSDGMDRHRQMWIEAKCATQSARTVEQCQALNTTTTTTISTTTTTITTTPPTTTTPTTTTTVISTHLSTTTSTTPKSIITSLPTSTATRSKPSVSMLKTTPDTLTHFSPNQKTKTFQETPTSTFQSFSERSTIRSSPLHSNSPSSVIFNASVTKTMNSAGPTAGRISVQDSQDCGTGANSHRSDRCPSKVNVAVIVVVLLIIGILIGSVVGFVLYAYKNPNSRAGIWLIEHRPSKIASSIASKVSFWKRNNSNAGDKYEVSITPTAGQPGPESIA